MMDATQVEAMVVRALTSWGIGREAIAAEFGVSGAMIGHIRRGTRHAKVRPDLPRWRSCEHCIHWEEMRCTLDFPEPYQLGFLRAGTDCAAYMRPSR
jgi:hypothetical protein